MLLAVFIDADIPIVEALAKDTARQAIAGGFRLYFRKVEKGAEPPAHAMLLHPDHEPSPEWEGGQSLNPRATALANTQEAPQCA